jgi:5-methylcytosine-specific restriction endonuclease McrA
MTDSCCACGCGQPVAPRSDGKQQRYRKGHSGAGTLVSTACAECGAAITVARWRLDRFRFVTCSQRCNGAQRARLAQADLTCDHCGTTFRVKASSKQGARTFCSLACFGAANSAALRVRVSVECAGCAAPLLVHPSRARVNGRFYCGTTCRARHIIGPNNPSYTSGIGRKREYAANWKSQRRAAVLRDGARCRVCGARPARQRDLHVHHLIAARTFGGDWERANALDNLVTLCMPCHYLVERGKATVPPLAA